VGVRRSDRQDPRRGADSGLVAARRLVAALLVAASVAAMSACESLPFGPSEAGGTPEGTVAGYLDASVAGDCRLASRLATPDLVRQGLWCDNPRVLSYGEIGDGERMERDDEVYFVVDAVVMGGTGLDVLGLQAGENSILVQVLQEPDGTWRVNQTNGRDGVPPPP
jgi:hypothetical protein